MKGKGHFPSITDLGYHRKHEFVPWTEQEG